MIAAVMFAIGVSAADPCATLEPAAVPDPIAAAAYRSVADAEASAGGRDTAILAYRNAAAADPHDAASRAALDRLCAAGRSADPFGEGLALMDAGDLRRAAATFSAVRGPDRPSAALLEGICRYELGEDREAEPLLRLAEGSPDNQDLARFYLGLVALRSGATAEAASLFDAAGASAALAPVSSGLAQLARTQGRWAFSLLAESGWDSNVNLAPPGAPPARQADGGYGLAAAAVFRPSGPDGGYLRARGLLHQQLRLGTYDVAGGDAAAGWQLRGGGWSLLGEYDYAYSTFGGSPFLQSHRLLASGWTVLGGVTLGATGLVRFESYASGWSPFSGTVGGGEARASFGMGPRARLALAYYAAHDSARYSILSFLEYGPRAELRIAVGRGVRFGADAAVTLRSYDDYDPTLLVRRRDTYLDAAGLAELDLSQGWTARLSLQGRRALSNDAGFAYAKVVPTLGLAYTFAP